ncbi:uncharacterized protein LOC134040860 [Osmerus eperlanus]|uniref:uncharacterized protein LOC134040860 n=1 Tax=Osmerus eperlanus TaxID=29151 RepID=UPI002E11E220
MASQFLKEFRSCGDIPDPRQLMVLTSLVSKNLNVKIPLKNPDGCSWRIGGLKDTIYYENPKEVEEWEKFYLPEYVKMEVLGTVEDIPCQGTQLVIVVGEDRNIYGHDGETLHLVASSIKELCTSGIQYPGIKTFYRGECFKNMTEMDWEAVRKGSVGRQLDSDHKALVNSAKSGIRQRLAEIKRQRQGDASKLEKEPPTHQNEPWQMTSQSIL